MLLPSDNFHVEIDFGLLTITNLTTGAVATLEADEGGALSEVVVRAFAHPRVIIGDFDAAATLVRRAMKAVNPSALRVELVDHFASGVEHFVIATYDACLEVLAANEPRIRPM